MKKLLILSLVFVLLVVSTLPALAKKETYDCGDAPTQPNKRYALAGWVQYVNASNKTVTVEVAVGNVLAKPCIGEEEGVVLIVDADTILKYSGGAPMTFEQLKIAFDELDPEVDPRLQISSTGFLPVDKEWSALQITLGADLTNK